MMSGFPALVRACIFDLDGVVVDTFRYHYQAWRRVASRLGIDFTEEQHNRLQGLSRMESLEKILDWGGVYLPDAEKLHWTDVKNNWYVELVAHMSPAEVLPGVRDFLQHLQNDGLPAALVSSSRNARSVLQSTCLESFFAVVIDGNIIKKAKPDPERYLLAATALGSTPGECLVFEDAPAGIYGATYAGFPTVGVGMAEGLQQAGVLIPGFTDLCLADLLARWPEKVS